MCFQLAHMGYLLSHSRYLGLVWLILPRNFGMCSVRKEENLNPKRSPENNTYVRARGAPWMSGFWTPAGGDKKVCRDKDPDHMASLPSVAEWFPFPSIGFHCHSFGWTSSGLLCRGFPQSSAAASCQCQVVCAASFSHLLM